jgi:hypothetical protein
MFVLNRLTWLEPVRETDMPDTDGRRALARDIGVPVSAFSKMKVCVSTDAELFDLMGALSIDQEDARREHPQAMRAMQSACASCEAKRRCRRNLRRETAASTYRQYCPNAEALRQLAEPA